MWVRQLSPPTPPEAYLATMLRVAIVLLWQHDDQRVDSHEWKSAPNHWLPTKRRVPNAYVGVFDDQVMSLEVRAIIMHVFGMCRLALMTLARVGKRSR